MRGFSFKIVHSLFGPKTPGPGALLIVSATGVRPMGRSDKIFETAPKTEGPQNYQSLVYFFFNFFLEFKVQRTLVHANYRP